MMNMRNRRMLLMLSALLVVFFSAHVHAAYGTRLLLITLKINNTANTVYIPGNGSFTVSQRSAGEFSSPPHYYITSASAGSVKGLVYQALSPTSIIFNKTGSLHTLRIKQNATGSLSYLVFTKGSHRAVEERIRTIERGDFLKQMLPSFAFGLGSVYRIMMVLKYPAINITDGLVLHGGDARFTATNIGVSGNKTMMDFQRM